MFCSFLTLPDKSLEAQGDLLGPYLHTFEELRARKRWSTQSVTFRVVALSLGAAAGA